MLSKKEKKIIWFIRYAPMVFIVILSLLITLLFVFNKYTEYQNNLKKLEKEFYLKSKEKIKSEVDRVFNYIEYERKNNEDNLKKELKERTEEFYRIIEDIYNKYKNIESEEKIKDRIRDIVYSYKFYEGRGYFYITKLDGLNEIHGSNKHLENTNIKYLVDKNNTFMVKEIIEELRHKDEVFTNYYWNKPDDLSGEYKKIAFSKFFAPYNWYISTGEYIVDFENKLKKEIINYLNNLKYSQNGYVFIFDYDGINWAHIKDSYRGVNRIDLTDKNGYKITQGIIKAAKKGEGFITYIGTIKPDTKMPALKTTYVRGLEDWNWAIGTGFYADELEEQLEIMRKDLDNKNKKELVELILICLFSSIASLILFIYISRVLESQFISYKKEVSLQISENRKKDSLLAQQSKMAAMGEMLANIAHQWRQPLNTISTIASGLKFKNEFMSIEKSDVDESMDKITDSSQYLSQTIEDFRHFFDPDKKKVYFDLKESIEKTFTLLEHQFIKEDIKIIKNLDEIKVKTYKNELIQVFINILNNSKDELVKKQLKYKVIKIDTYIKKQKVYIVFKDNAGGISEDIIDRIFEPYFTTKHKAQGTGIGLYMTRQIIVKHMKGKIEVSNEEFVYEEKVYKGACFKIALDIE